jgi:BMFP domain-containing protein YqiC
MWLTGRLMPDHKTIANFRKDNGSAIRKVCREFIILCRQLNLFTRAIVAIDSSKFQGVNSRSKNFTRSKLKRRIERIEKSLEQYFSELDSADRDESSDSRTDTSARIKDKIAALKKRMAELKVLESQVLELPEKQISLTDPESRSMRSNSATAGVVGYNVQTAVDIEHHLIVTHEVNNVGSDRSQLSNMAMKARTAMDTKELTALADRGYFNGEEILACDQAGILTYVPKSETSTARAAGRFDRSDFRYMAETDEYRCPAGERLIRHMTTVENKRTLHRYWSSNCQHCHLKPQCTPSKQRRVARWEHEAVLEAAQERLDHAPGIMTVRKSTAEHPFGTIKSWMGSTHFLMKGLKHVGTEMSLHVLAYNLKRVMAIIGIKPLITAIQA